MRDRPKEPLEGPLERTLGLRSALAIGIGTMLGAGVFVFPGLAGGEAGPAAMVSFAIGGVIALLVALCTAELATAMPKNGGAYHYVSRTLGDLAGTVVGGGQVVGLIFATGFYLVAFGRYSVECLRELGVTSEPSALPFAVAAAIALTCVNLFSAQATGRLQTIVVVTLSVPLAVVFGFGLLVVTGVFGDPAPSRDFAPRGVIPIFDAAALTFTAYLGFAQIATVAGEIKKPDRNLPRALLGSVLVVSTVYIAVLFITTSLYPVDRLETLGETAVPAIAEKLLGDHGPIVVLVAGVLATISSANASILSSSRAVFALSRDGLAPKRLAMVNDRYGTPTLALLSVGSAVVLVTLLDSLETLAEVASILHLILYSAICLVVLIRRRRGVDVPSGGFRVPAAFLVASVGALAPIVLTLFMREAALAITGGIVLALLLLYPLRARDRRSSENSDRGA